MKVPRFTRLFVLIALVLGVLAAGAAARTSGKCDGPCATEKVLERNKANVVAFYTLAFNDNKPAEAVAKYGGDEYIQHNPLAANGFDAFIQFFTGFKTAFPDAHLEIKRVIAEDNLVVTHSLITGATLIFGPRGSKVVDIFRLDAHGKVVEHWDVLAQISANSANGNPEI